MNIFITLLSIAIILLIAEIGFMLRSSTMLTITQVAIILLTCVLGYHIIATNKTNNDTGGNIFLAVVFTILADISLSIIYFMIPMIIPTIREYNLYNHIFSPFALQLIYIIPFMIILYIQKKWGFFKGLIIIPIIIILISGTCYLSYLSWHN